MKHLHLAALGLLAACASAPISRTGPDEWVIGGSNRDAWHSNVSVRNNHDQRAITFCGGTGGRAETFEPAQTDGQYHFRCIPPEHSRAEELQSARDAWRECMIAEEPAVDDLMSDGHTVAAVLATRCTQEVSNLVAIAGKGYRYWSMPDDALQRIRRDAALEVVLRTRALKRNPDAKLPPITLPSIGPGG